MKGLRVLIVEDDLIIAMLLAEVLVYMGHKVCATEATELGAIISAARYKPDLLIVDARLREGSGASAVDHILLLGFIPHIFVSGEALAPQTLSSRAVFLRKPYTETELSVAIQRAFASQLDK